MAGETRPNVLIILADDLGYGDLGCYGQTRFDTPAVDRLAAEGLRFTQFYAGSTVCAPSRCALLTGRHTGHTSIRGNQEARPEGQAPMPQGTRTMAHLMQNAGYRTGLFGKWGLGAPGSVSTPPEMGFARFYGYNCQRIAHSYYPAFLWSDNERQLLWGNVAQKTGDYAPALIQQQLLEFLRQDRGEPFFCLYAPLQPHADMTAPEAYLAEHRGRYGEETPYADDYYNAQREPKAAFAAMVAVLDEYVGEIVACLEAEGLADNTLVMFTSDNGPHHEGGHDPEYFDSNGPLRGGKRDLYEGGIRVPLVAKWPARITAGRTADHPCAAWDLMATVAELLNRPAPGDGLSMLPTLLGRPGQPTHESLYWEFPGPRGAVAIRQGDWKLVVTRRPETDGAVVELFDLAADPGETSDLSDRRPEVTSRLLAAARESRRKAELAKFNDLPSLPR